MISFEGGFQAVHKLMGLRLREEGKTVHVGEWQSIKDDKMPQSTTVELRNVVFSMPIPRTEKDLIYYVKPNLPFAEAQFQDRVSGEPLNPPPSDKLWPWAHHLDDDKPQGKYSHTYPERFWPKVAGPVPHRVAPLEGPTSQRQIHGIRYPYGDLGDLVSLLSRSPYTRQAYLPVWFPEDTGAVHGERVPCSLGYHFLLREGKLHVTYFIRSVDFFRHFPDDVYMAARLGQWVLQKLKDQEWNEQMAGTWETVKPGDLTMHIGSLHVFEAERKRLENFV